MLEKGIIVILSFVAIVFSCAGEPDHYSLAEREYEARNYGKASILYKAALRERKDDVAVLLKIAECEISLRNIENALSFAERAIDIQPSLPAAKLLLARIYQLDEQWEAAERLYGRLLQDEPDNPAVLYSLSLVNEKLGKPVEAQKYYDKYEAMKGRNQP